jgi:deoxyribonuclease-4
LGKRCLGVVVHLGKNVEKNGISDDQAKTNYAYGIDHVLQKIDGGTVIIETCASQGKEIGGKMKDLKDIYDRIKDKSRIKFCIDTCHIWSAGYDIGTKKGSKKFLESFNKLFGYASISCIHFNNSMNDLGSHIDRHANLEHGKIGIEGLEEFAKIINKHKIPIILETPNIIPFEEEKKLIKLWFDKQ